jgi:hypothetical protein
MALSNLNIKWEKATIAPFALHHDSEDATFIAY